MISLMESREAGHAKLIARQSEAGAALVHEISPAPDPAVCFRSLADHPHVLFLDSAAQQGKMGRYSYLAADPYSFLEIKDGRARVDGTWRDLLPNESPLDLLAGQLDQFKGQRLAGLPPFQGGAAGVFGYELAHYFEKLPRPAIDLFAVPDLALGFYDWVLAWDHVSGRAWVFSTGFPERDADLRRRRAEARLAMALSHLARTPTPLRPRHSPPASTNHSEEWPVPWLNGLSSNFSPDAYADAVCRAIEYIHAGDCFQVNIAQRLRSACPVAAVDLYLRLRSKNPAPFGGYFDQGEFVLASASPERFLHVEDGIVDTRPIKGTRPRWPEPRRDADEIRALEASAKDRSENVMIVDLMRNDLGRVCSYGTIDVPSLCQVESFAYVHHLVSAVRGRLRPDCGCPDLLRAAFPGGSVTGAPKIRAMEIIAELERVARGWYCGSLGWLGFDGSMDTNILIRSFILRDGWAQFSVGGGVVADSEPRREYEETWHKAQGMLRALGAE
jgi:para-aminobenzoate synthetase component I